MNESWVLDPEHAFTLPAGSRPDATLQIPQTVGLRGELAGYIQVTPSGEVTCHPRPGYRLPEWRLEARDLRPEGRIPTYLRSPEYQRNIDLETIRAHLDRGTEPWTGVRMWGGLEWAIARVLDMEDFADAPPYDYPGTPVHDKE